MAKQLINFRADDGIGAFPYETPMTTGVKLALSNFLAGQDVPLPPVFGPTVGLV